MTSTATTYAPTTAAATTSPRASSAAADAAAKLGGDMQTFLKMLTTQLQNQDPTQPLDPNQFTSQLSQFAAVEQQIAVNQHLESLIGLQRSSMVLSAASLVGRAVDVESDTLALSGGRSQTLRLPAATATSSYARLSVTDASGQVIRQAVTPLGSSASAWTWDGRDVAGRAVADGNYKIGVVGLDAAGTERGALTSVVTGTVTGTGRDGDSQTLSLGPLSVPVDAIRDVRN
jgi:flagellar basal-body rod modification protein FlgD